MKIALIAEQAGPSSDPAASTYPGDPASRIRHLAAALAGLDHQVTVYTRRGTARSPAADATTSGMRLESVSAGPDERLSTEKVLPHAGTFARSLAGIWQRNPPDVAHALDWIGGLAALGGARDLGIPVVQTFGSVLAGAGRGPGGPTGARGDQARLEAGIGASASAVLTGHAQDLAALVRRGMPRTAITIVPDGVDTNLFRPSGPVAQRTAAPRLLMFAPLAQWPAIATAMHALARVPSAELVIATGLAQPQLRSAPGHREIARIAAELGVRHRLIFAGRLSVADAPALLRSADIALSPVGAEPFAMVGVEAMACGVPVIATAAGAQRDAVIHGTTGFLVPPDDPDLLAGRIRQLLASAMVREGCGIAAVTRARARYSWERIARETLAVYQGLTARAAASAA